MDFRSEKLLLVDIGGTNFRSAISYLGSDEVLETKKQNVECLENFSSLVNDLLEEHGPIEHAVFQ
jgi:hexokinase